MKPKTLISLSGGVISNPLRRLPAPASFELRQGECIAVVGPNGSGKSTLLEMIRGGFYLREGTLRFNLEDENYRAIRVVKFDNAYSTTETQYYHQQRWQAFEREASPLAGELLGEATDTDNTWRQRLFTILDIRPLLGKAIITLSSGELRRFSIARALLQRPQILILESPFIGLDPPTRQALCKLLEQLLHELGISIVLTLTDMERIPPVTTHVYLMNEGRISGKCTVTEVLGQQYPKSEVGYRPALAREGTVRASGRYQLQTKIADQIAGRRDIPVGNFFHEAPAFDKVVEMRHVNISYGERQIFRDLNWTVRSGEKWNVTGPNGSGKSTLLSLVNADNPRAYSLDITLFDRRRGTGESIWDIKRHIGYLSSEMHSSFITSDTVLDIIRSGLDRDSDGRLTAEAVKGFATGAGAGGNRLNVREQDLHTRHSPVADSVAYTQDNTENILLMRWLELFGADHLSGRAYNTLSSGEQRYVLLIRAFVKDPDLLILDEPFQGLDSEMRRRAASVIEAFCAAKNKTLIFVTHYIEEIPGVVTHTLQL